MQKTLLYLVLLAVLGFGVYYFLFSNNESGFSSKDAAFNVRDTGVIGKIFITDNSGESVLLERSNKGWIVNKEYKAMASPINTLLQTLARQVAAYPASKKVHNNVIKDMTGNALKVELYNRSGEKMRVFYIGGQVHDDDGSYMLMEGAETPYVVKVPGFTGYLSPRYPIKIEDWRDRNVFDIPAADIRSVSVQYPSEPLNSFTIKQENGKVSVVADPGVISHFELNERRAKLYLTYFEKINCEGYTNGTYGMDSVLRVTPKRCSIDVTDTAGRSQHVDIYWRPIGRRSKNLEQSNAITPDDYDSDRFYAVLNNNKDTAVVQVYTFYKLFHKAYEFYQADEVNTEFSPVPKQK
ncbi:MAG: hypothetical protein BGO69_12985 [Bacteroidetes bacterium 46-16]|nr:MAG: hypothetical protein BGO69_12985 [Bacteroidetes bacterium 46-16]